MVFKLVRKDIPDASKIELPEGLHIIGRRNFLESQKCDDRKISRNHGKLLVTPTSVTLIAIHHNPCFYIRKGTGERRALRGTSVDLYNGDKFGLLPNNFWYELIHSTSEMEDDTNNTGAQPINTAMAIAPVTTVTTAPLTATSDDAVEFLSTAPASETLTAAVPSTVASVNAVTRTAPDNTSDLPTSNFPAQVAAVDPTHSSVSTPNPQADDASSALPSHKRNHSPENEKQEGESSNKVHITDDPGLAQPGNSTVRIKVEPGLAQPGNSTVQVKVEPGLAQPETSAVQVKVEPGMVQPETSAVQVKNEPGLAQLGTSAVQVKNEPGLVQPGTSTVQDSNPGPSVTTNNNQNSPPNLRQRCMYGTNCYRRNLEHKAKFSHPNDPDWGTGEKAPCPWGAKCCKRDPRHWRDHEHPPGTFQPPNNRGKRKKISRDQLSPEIVLPLKRPKKVVERQTLSDWSDEDDDENVDPYATDGESDDWVPDDEDEYTPDM